MKVSKSTLLALVLGVSLLTGCTDPQGAKQTLSDNGYTDIHITGYDFWACSDNDKFSTGFTAKSPSGKYVTGTVCSGFFKGKTIRFD